MAEKLATFDFTAPSAITSPTEKAVYPWEEWLDGDIWQLTQDEDFDTHPLMMERIIRTRATARGAKVRLRHQPKNEAGKRGKRDPFGIIILQRSDIVGPAAADAAAADAAQAKQERARARAEKKAAAEKDALETLTKAGIKPTKKAAASRNGVGSKSVAKRPTKTVKNSPATKHAVSKRPARKVGA
jgi:hypothetical protein